MMRLDSRLSLLRGELHGVMTSAQAQWRIQRAQSSLDSGQPERALDALIQLARAGTELNLSTHAWRELLVVMLTIATHAGLRDTLADIFEQYAWLAWSGQSRSAEPWALGEAMRAAEQRGTWTTGALLGDLITRSYASCALGPYAAAHFRELDQLATRDPATASAQAQANAQRFARAQTLAEDEGRAQLAQHCALRRGVALLMSGAERRQGRQLLKQLDRKQLSPEERMWYALGMSRSDFWLDRVRGADLLDALAQDVHAARPDARHISPELIERVARFVLDHEHLDIQETEEDRMRELIKEVWRVATSRDQQLAALELRLELGRAAEHTPDDAEHLARLLEQRAQDDVRGEDPAWRRSASSFRFLTRHLDPDLSVEDLGPIPRNTADEHLRHAHHALTLLRALREEDDAALEQALRETRRDLRVPQHLSPAQHLAPLGSAWPMLLERLSRKLPRDESGAVSEPAREARAVLVELADECLVVWARHAPRPSYGWWPLAAHAIQAQLGRGADGAARRALEQREHVEDRLRDRVLGALISWTAKHGERVSLLRWLDFAESLHTPDTRA